MKVYVPTMEELVAQDWQPDPAALHRLITIEVNVTTGERTEIPMTLEAIRQRHIRKLTSQNERFDRDAAQQMKDARDAKLAALIDALEADPALLDKLKRSR